MVGYVTIGTNDIERAARFYDQLLAEIGAKRFMETETFIAWSVSPEAPALSVTQPFDGQPATVGNGVMVALQMDGKDKVDGLHRKALELGATDEVQGLDGLANLVTWNDRPERTQVQVLDLSTLDEPTEKPSKHDAACLADMVKVEAPDTMGKKRNAVELLCRHT